MADLFFDTSNLFGDQCDWVDPGVPNAAKATGHFRQLEEEAIRTGIAEVEMLQYIAGTTTASVNAPE